MQAREGAYLRGGPELDGHQVQVAGQAGAAPHRGQAAGLGHLHPLQVQEGHPVRIEAVPELLQRLGPLHDDRWWRLQCGRLEKGTSHIGCLRRLLLLYV